MENRSNLTKAERSEIGILRERGYSLRAIARALARSPNSISYEVRRNSVEGCYDPRKADRKARARKKYRRYQYSKIEREAGLRAYVITGLLRHWNPDEIAGSMKRKKTPFYASKTAIYDWLRSIWGQRYCAYLYSERWYRKRRRPKAKRQIIHARRPIHERFLGAAHRTRYGHFEEDTLVSGKHGTGAAAVMVERKSRLVVARTLPSLSPAVHAGVIRGMMRGMSVRSITFDNGIENRAHETLGAPAFFCDPYASWQKGSVENANKMIRRYLPKRTNLSEVSQERLDHIVSVINGKPRKILGYRSALEVATRAGVLLQETKNTAVAGCPN
jgi:IS30 family transposase